MPASKKILKNQKYAANKAAGVGDENGRMPAREKKTEVFAKCTICSLELRMTARNVEAKSHFESRHPTSTFAACFPGQADPTVATLSEEETKSSQSSATAQPTSMTLSKKREDLSFLDAALNPQAGKKK